MRITIINWANSGSSNFHTSAHYNMYWNPTIGQVLVRCTLRIDFGFPQWAHYSFCIGPMPAAVHADNYNKLGQFWQKIFHTSAPNLKCYYWSDICPMHIKDWFWIFLVGPLQFFVLGRCLPQCMRITKVNRANSGRSFSIHWPITTLFGMILLVLYWSDAH